jgi:hypothetical protein
MSIEHAQQYLAKVLPWPQEGDALPSYVNIHWSLNKLGQNGKPLWTGRATRSVQEAANTVSWALRSADTKDIYVCMSSQAQALEKVSKKGNTYLAAIRDQENVVALKGLFLDVDAKGADKNSYATMPEAAAALAAFIKVMDLPPPSAIVNSGGGLHVYWTLTAHSRATNGNHWRTRWRKQPSDTASSATPNAPSTRLASFVCRALSIASWMPLALLLLLVGGPVVIIALTGLIVF